MTPNPYLVNELNIHTSRHMVKGVGLVFKDESRVCMEAGCQYAILIPRGLYRDKAAEHNYMHVREFRGDLSNVII